MQVRVTVMVWSSWKLLLFMLCPMRSSKNLVLQKWTCSEGLYTWSLPGGLLSLEICHASWCQSCVPEWKSHSEENDGDKSQHIGIFFHRVEMKSNIWVVMRGNQPLSRGPGMEKKYHHFHIHLEERSIQLLFPTRGTFCFVCTVSWWFCRWRDLNSCVVCNECYGKFVWNDCHYALHGCLWTSFSELCS